MVCISQTAELLAASHLQKSAVQDLERCGSFAWLLAHMRKYALLEVTNQMPFQPRQIVGCLAPPTAPEGSQYQR